MYQQYRVLLWTSWHHFWKYFYMCLAEFLGTGLTDKKSQLYIKIVLLPLAKSFALKTLSPSVMVIHLKHIFDICSSGFFVRHQPLKITRNANIFETWKKKGKDISTQWCQLLRCIYIGLYIFFLTDGSCLQVKCLTCPLNTSSQKLTLSFTLFQNKPSLQWQENSRCNFVCIS